MPSAPSDWWAMRQMSAYIVCGETLSARLRADVARMPAWRSVRTEARRRRAFSIASAAWFASASRICSSCSLNSRPTAPTTLIAPTDRWPTSRGAATILRAGAPAGSGCTCRVGRPMRIASEQQASSSAIRAPTPGLDSPATPTITNSPPSSIPTREPDAPRSSTAWRAMSAKTRDSSGDWLISCAISASARASRAPCETLVAGDAANSRTVGSFVVGEVISADTRNGDSSARPEGGARGFQRIRRCPSSRQ